MTSLRRFAAGNPFTVAWFILVAATGIGWWFGHMERAGQSREHLAMAGVVVTAFLKAWIVGFQFMELKHAPRWLRHAYDVWVVGVCSTLLVICLR